MFALLKFSFITVLMTQKTDITAPSKAMAVHLLTATGAVFAMLALLAAVNGAWDTMFLWLVVAFVVDGIDGPLARRYDVKTHAPQFDGVLLDLIIDYLTYVFIPAYALFASGLLAGWTGWAAIIVITFTSAMYFADTRMKTQDNSFSGFPGCWNMAILVIFATAPNHWVILAAVTALAALMFAPIKFIHPTRTECWRPISIVLSLAWIGFATWAAWGNFNVHPLAEIGLLLTTVYLLFAGALQQWFVQK